MKKILVVGSPGAGKTTFSKILSLKTQIPLYHLDNLYWCGSWENLPPEEFDIELMKLMEKETWILDGNFSRTLLWRIEHCDTIIFLDYSRVLCTYSVIKRWFVNYGKARHDMHPECIEKISLAFLKTVWDFPKERRVQIVKSIEHLESKKIIQLKNRKKSREWLNSLGKNRRI